MTNKFNTLYYFTFDDKENLKSKIDVEELPQWMLDAQVQQGKAEDFKEKESEICSYDHPLPCGLDKKCNFC